VSIRGAKRGKLKQIGGKGEMNINMTKA